MNLIAVDIGNTNIKMGLFLDGEEKLTASIPERAKSEITEVLQSYWAKVPLLRASKEEKRDGVIVVSSVKEQSGGMVRKIAKENLNEKILVIGVDVPFPMDLSVSEPEKVGTDRIVSAAAAYSVVESAVVVADFGSAVTIDVVDDRGVFAGGVIVPGFEMGAKALENGTSQLPKVKVTRPEYPFGQDTKEAINCGLYYQAIGTLEEVVRRYSQEIGSWPKTIVTGGGAQIIADDCDFIDSYVPDLVLKGIALSYRRYIEHKSGG